MNKIKFHVFPWLIVAFIWSYGYMGVLTKIDLAVYGLISIILISILFILFFIKEKYFSNQSEFDLILADKSNFSPFLLILITIMVIMFFRYSFPLHGDEMFHAFYSQYQSIFVSLKMKSIFPELRLKDVTWAFSAISLSAVVMLIYLIHNKIKYRYKYLLISVLFLVLFRVFLSYIGGFDPTHPPMRLFPLWVSSSIFSVSSFSFRLPGILALSVIGLLVFIELKKMRLRTLYLWLSVFSIISIPVLWHTSYIVEPSIWAALFAMYFLLKVSDGRFKELNFFVLFSLLSIFILIRQSLIYMVPVIFCLLLFEKNIKATVKLKQSFINLSPLLISAPLILRNILSGTPATMIAESQNKLSAIDSVLHAITSGILWKITITNLEIWAAFIIFAFVPPKQNRLKYIFVLIVFFSSSLVVFYSINFGIWGNPRYQVEFLVPLGVLGFIRLISLISNGFSTYKNIILLVLLSTLLSYNIYTIFISYSDKNTVNNGFKVITSHEIYDYESAMLEAAENGYSGKMIVLDHSYGIINEVIYGYTVSEANDNEEIQKYHNFWGNSLNIDDIINDHRIDLVLITADFGFLYNNKIRSALNDGGFHFWKDFSSIDSTERIDAFVRN